MDLEHMTKEQVLDLNIPTGVPVTYEIDASGRVVTHKPPAGQRALEEVTAMYSLFVSFISSSAWGSSWSCFFRPARGRGLATFRRRGGRPALSAPSGTAFIKKVTTGMAIVFIITSVMLTILILAAATFALREPSRRPKHPRSVAHFTDSYKEITLI